MTSEPIRDASFVKNNNMDDQQQQQLSQHSQQNLQDEKQSKLPSSLTTDPPKFLPFNELISQNQATPIPQPMQQPVHHLSPKQLTQTANQTCLLNQVRVPAPAEATNPDKQSADTVINPSLIQTVSLQLEQETQQSNNGDQQQQQTVLQIQQQQNQIPTPATTASSTITFPTTPTKAVVTQTVNLTQDMNLFEWFRTTDIINQIAEKAKHSVDSVITTLDPGMKEYLFSGGNINIVVVTDHDSHVSPIRDAFLSVFGRATITTCFAKMDYPIRVALGYNGALEVARSRIDKLRQEASTFPQNQVVLVIQPTLVNCQSIRHKSGDTLNQISSNNNESPDWFYTYASILDDPVLGVTSHTFSQLIPIDLETVVTLRDDDSDATKELGFCKSLDETMNTELKILPIDQEDMTSWIKVWSGLEDKRIIHDSAISLAHSYQRKWNNNVVK